MVNNDPHVT